MRGGGKPHVRNFQTVFFSSSKEKKMQNVLKRKNIYILFKNLEIKNILAQTYVLEHSGSFDMHTGKRQKKSIVGATSTRWQIVLLQGLLVVDCIIRVCNLHVVYNIYCIILGSACSLYLIFIVLLQGLLVALQNASAKSLIVVFTDNGSKDLKLEKEIVRSFNM